MVAYEALSPQFSSKYLKKTAKIFRQNGRPSLPDLNPDFSKYVIRMLSIFVTKLIPTQASIDKMYYNISHLFLKNSIRHICYGAAVGGTERKRDRQCTYERDFKVHSCFHFCLWKAISTIYSGVCVCSLTYPTIKAHALYYIVISSLSNCTMFFHIIS